MAENPPTINRRLHREFGGRFAVGTGVFVLVPDEVDRLNLSSAERALLRPYYDTKAVGRYRIADEPTHQVLYLSRSTAPKLEGLPGIAAHLEPFRPILERRREVRIGRIAWWHLHWPRDEQIFIRPRLLRVQMGKRPQVVFVGAAHIRRVLDQPDFAAGKCRVTLDVLAGILNSDLAGPGLIVTPNTGVIWKSTPISCASFPCRGGTAKLSGLLARWFATDRQFRTTCRRR